MKTLAAALILVGACALLAIVYDPSPAPRGAGGRTSAPLAQSVAWNGTAVACETASQGCAVAALRIEGAR